MFGGGIDPHKGSHTAAVRNRLLRCAECFEPHTWAIEAASGLGRLLAQQLLAAGEVVLDVPPAHLAGGNRGVLPGRWMGTGDAARMDDEGYVQIVDFRRSAGRP